MTIAYKKKLIEVALPLPEINDASAYDKMPGIGPHPKGIHHWWARLPLPTARAVLFASVVTDPSDDPAWKDKGEEEQDAERERLFDIIRRMMVKKLHTQPKVYAEARAEMLKHCDGKLPPVFDPFAGGGSIPLEAARLGFEAHAADLNPVAVLLNKCNLELAPRWTGQAPVNPQARMEHTGAPHWEGTRGLAEDVRYYGRKIREEAQKKIGRLYPKVRLPNEYGGGDANVIAWFWVRTVASQDPAARGAHVPLLNTFWLSTKDGNLAWLEPVVDRAAGTYRFEVKTGTPADKNAIRAGTKMGRRAFRCLLSGEPLEYAYIRAQAKEQKLGCVLTCIVAEKKGGRIYLPADAEHELLGRINEATWKPEEIVTTPCHDVDRLPMYGMPIWSDAFTPRQLTALATLTDLVKDMPAVIKVDAQRAGLSIEDSDAYAKTVSTFLALAVDRLASFNNSLCRWNGSQTVFLFARQAIPMIWDFPEANVFGEKAICWLTSVDICAEAIETIAVGIQQGGNANQSSAVNEPQGSKLLLVSTDPPYYDNIGYAALSDFYYVWLRRSIGGLYPDIFSTVLVPKMPELTAAPERYGGNRQKAKDHFESGFREVFCKLRDRLDHRFPLTVYYAFKQNDDENNGEDDEREAANGSVDLTTGWETLLEALVSSGFTITATWPVRASFKWRIVSHEANTLASYIVLACRPRAADTPRTGRNAFVAELKRELPAALRHLQQGNVAPVDFAQAAIGPGMAVFSRYGAVLESNGKPMTVRTALSLINGIKDELLGEAVEELDKDTRWATAWFAETGFEWGEAGQANLLANAQATAMNGLVTAGIVEVKGNQVRLFRPEELPADWDPATDKRLTVWEMTHHLIRLYVHEKRGDRATAELLHRLGTKAEVARDLAYKLFTVCENKKRSQEAQAYNALVMGWSELARLSRETAKDDGSPEPHLPGME